MTWADSVSGVAGLVAVLTTVAAFVATLVSLSAKRPLRCRVGMHRWSAPYRQVLFVATDMSPLLSKYEYRGCTRRSCKTVVPVRKSHKEVQ